jgi:type 1 glutamine amidotransferase
MSPEALIVWGGWNGHFPREIAQIFESLLALEGFRVSTADSLDVFAEADLSTLSLIVPVWTMGKITNEQLRPMVDAVIGGTGIAGCHGGMCDAFRDAPEYQFMTGGQWVAHPGNDGVEYVVRVLAPEHFITQGIRDFTVKSEQYYMHVDPSNHVLATTRFPTADGPHAPNGAFDMPVIWTRYHGKGRVFYSSLGHTPDVVKIPEHLEILRRGLRWAAKVAD